MATCWTTMRMEPATLADYGRWIASNWRVYKLARGRGDRRRMKQIRVTIERYIETVREREGRDGR